MELSVGDLQILYYMAVKGSAAEEGKSSDADSKAAEMVEDAMRGEV